MANETSYKHWDQKGTEAKELIKQLDLYVSTNGAAGINPEINKPAVILSEIYNKYSYLKVFNPKYFPDRYRKLKAKWVTAKASDRARVPETNTQG
jgi:hypothetical protein